jgi:hypothetical protein
MLFDMEYSRLRFGFLQRHNGQYHTHDEQQGADDYETLFKLRAAIPERWKQVLREKIEFSR